MTAYTPTVIAAGALDGSVVDENFDDFQAATCNLDGTNFNNTSSLGFKHLHAGASTETFIENGNGPVALYNAFQATTSWASFPYPNSYFDTKQQNVSDTEVVFVAKKDGVAYITATASIHRPKGLWFKSTAARQWISTRCGIYFATGLSRWDGNDPVGGSRVVQWGSGPESNERTGVDIRLTAKMDITRGERYSFFMSIALAVKRVAMSSGNAFSPAWAMPAALADPTFWPHDASVVSIAGGSRQTAVTCVYK